MIPLQIYGNNQIFAEISRKFFQIGDNIGIRVNPSVDDDTTLIILGIVIANHNELEKARRNKN